MIFEEISCQISGIFRSEACIEPEGIGISEKLKAIYVFSIPNSEFAAGFVRKFGFFPLHNQCGVLCFCDWLKDINKMSKEVAIF